jgi:Pyruvate phosphate dikinase, AMP/ATP-binding domain
MHDLFLIGPDGEPQALASETAGAKAAELWQMTRLGLNVPPAFVLSTHLCGPINRGENEAEHIFDRCLGEGISYLERATRRGFGDPRNPLLVSVRSGAARSMPGMLDTVLDVGLNVQTVRGPPAIRGLPGIRIAALCKGLLRSCGVRRLHHLRRDSTLSSALRRSHTMANSIPRPSSISPLLIALLSPRPKARNSLTIRSVSLLR